MVNVRKPAADSIPTNRLESAIEEFLTKRGMLDTDEWLSRFPDCTTELLEFMNNQAQIGAMAAAFSGPVAMPACRIGEYEILEIVDRGGMGIVYKARQHRLRRIVALKMIHQGQFSSPDARRRFQNEAETVARLRHPNLVTIHEVGEHNGIPFFSMEFIKGRTLSDLAKQGRIRPAVVAQITQSIADTIHYIHGCGVLHRDLKPSNVMIDHNCDVRVTDFGLAKQLDRNYSMTETGQILGSIDYMPPEQAEARHELMGPASDVYAIGAILFELLTGRPPFRCETFLETLRQIREQTPIRPSQLNSRVPADLEAICLKCLEKKPSRRYASAAELSQALERFLNEQPVHPGTARRISNFVRSNRWLLMMTSIAAVAVSAVGLAWSISSGWNSDDPTIAAVAGATAAELPVNTTPQGTVPDVTDPSGDVEDNPVQLAADAALTGDSSAVGSQATSPATNPPVNIAAADVRLPAGDQMLRHQVLSALSVAGEPFGVARIELELNAESAWKYRSDQPLRVVTADGRALYSSFHYAPAKAATKRVAAEPARLTSWFLFSGAAPLKAALVSADDLLASVIDIRIADAQESRSQLLEGWWKHFCNTDLPQASPELDSVNRYFVTMLGRRLNRRVPIAKRREQSAAALETEFERTVGMLFGLESVRLAMMAGKTIPAAQAREAAVLPLPAPLQVQSVPIPAGNLSVAIESIAMRVPEESFYLRCYRVKNYSWVRGLIQGWGGDLEGIVATSAVDYRVRDKIEKQLALSPSRLMETGIDDELNDCALIGLDTFFEDGAAVGVLFEGKQRNRLAEIIQAERQRVADAEHAVEGPIAVAGSTVQLLSTPHHQIRSYYAVSGRFHLVTNSQTLAQRFLETADGDRCLGNLKEYRYSRSEQQSEHNCAAWLYLSDPFFRNITSPEYRVELERRRQAARDLVTLHLARMAATAEGRIDLSLTELTRDGFLPDDFGHRPDHSQPHVSEGEVCDSLRGIHGTFLPIADVGVTKCTSFERSAYHDFTTAYQREWRTMDPVLLSFVRTESAHPNREKVILNIRITPYAQQEYRFLQQHLAKSPGTQRIAMRNDELLGLSSHLSGAGLSPWVHVGLTDADIDFELRDGTIHRLGENSGMAFSKSNTYALVTSGNKSGIQLVTDFVQSVKSRKLTSTASQPATAGLFGQIVAVVFPLDQIFRQMMETAIANYSQTDGKATVLSVNKAIGRAALAERRMENAERPAQLFLQLRDISTSSVMPYLRAYTYISSRRGSAGDTAALNRIADILQADPQSTFEQIEKTMGASLVCPIGGTYELTTANQRPDYWVSSSWLQPSVTDETEVPESYEFPFLKWLHGLDLECTLNATTLESRLELDISCTNDADFEPIPKVASARR